MYYMLEAAAFSRLMEAHAVHEKVTPYGVSILRHVVDTQCALERIDDFRCSRKLLTALTGISRPTVTKVVAKCVEHGWLQVRDTFTAKNVKEIYMKAVIPDEYLLLFLDQFVALINKHFRQQLDLEPQRPVEVCFHTLDAYIRKFAILIDRCQTSSKLVKDKLISAQGVVKNFDIPFKGGSEKFLHREDPEKGLFSQNLDHLVKNFDIPHAPLPLDEAMRRAEKDKS